MDRDGTGTCRRDKLAMTAPKCGFGEDKKRSTVASGFKPAPTLFGVGTSSCSGKCVYNYTTNSALLI
jgi:hypothetical protein